MEEKKGKIQVFWSPYHGQGQTSNLHTTSFIDSLLHKKKTLVMQSQFSQNNLESPLVGQNVDKNNSDISNLFQDIGLDAAVTFSNTNKLNLEMLEHCCLSFENNKQLLLLPGTEIKNRETFDRDIGTAISRVISDAKECVDIVLIDANSGNDKLSFNLMEIADQIVVNLTQRKYVLDNFFEEYGEFFENKGNVFYLFGDYDDNSSYNINNCRRKYSKFITYKNSGVIPYCTKYMDAQNESDVLRFMQNGLHVKYASFLDKAIGYFKYTFFKESREETEYFFHRSRLSVEKMFHMMDMSIRKERKEGGKT